MTEAENLKTAITALEAQRPILGDAVVDTALGPLRAKLATLEQPTQPPQQQRKLVSVLFADIVQSTEISQGLEPDEVLEIMDGALSRLSAPVTEYGGRVTRFMGDGFLAIFGLPVSQEDDARQAVRAGLGILATARACAEEFERTHRIRGMAVRVGINTGMVASGGFSEAEDTVMGVTVNLAARLEKAAPPGGLLISHYTLQQVSGLFEVEAQDPIEAKGFPEPVPVYLVKRVLPRTFRTVTRGIHGAETRTVGREAELQVLQQAFRSTMSQAESHVVTVSGDAGVGKSRLLFEFDQWLALQPVQVVAFKGRANPQTSRSPMSLLRDLFAYRFGILHSDNAAVARQKMEAGLAEFLAGEVELKSDYIGALLGFDMSNSPHLVSARNDPEQIRHLALGYLTEFTDSVTRHAPAVVMVEDIHWADEASLEAMAQIIRDCPHRRLLAIYLARPALFEQHPGWGEGEALGSVRGIHLPLEPLSRQVSLDLLAQILPDVDELPQELSDQLVTASEGNPFYLEELIKMAIDDGALQRNGATGRWRPATDNNKRLRVPPTLTAVLQARLDALPPAERTALQQASVVGRTFWAAAVQAMDGSASRTLRPLEALADRDLILIQDTSVFAGTGQYMFKHSMMRDVAYGTVPMRTRQAYHRHAAGWLVEATEASQRADEYAAVIADHYEQAAAPVSAVDWYVRAGARAQNQGAPAQAHGFLDRALALLPPSDRQRRWKALLARDQVLAVLGRTEERLADDAALVTLAIELDDDLKLAEAYYRQGSGFSTTGQYQEEFQAYEKAQSAARRAGSPRFEALVLGLKVVCLSRLGDMKAAEAAAEEALSLAHQSGDAPTLVKTLINVAVFYSEVGDMARATKLLQEQVVVNHRLGDREGEAIGLSNLGYNYVILGLYRLGARTLEHAVRLATKIGHRRFRAYGQLNLSLAYLLAGELGKAQGVVEQCMAELEAMNDTFGHAAGLCYLALSKERAGEYKSALTLFTDAQSTHERIGVIGYANDALAGRARCCMALGDFSEAHELAASLWTRLSEQGTQGMEFPMLAYQTCANIFTSAGDMTRVRAAIEIGYADLMARAERISEPRWRTAFLEDVVEHRKITERWLRLQLEHLQPA